MKSYQQFFAELKRRKVFRVMAVYGATAFVVLQVADLLAEGMGLSDQVLRVTTFLVLIGFPIAIVLAWAFETTPDGVRRTEDATDEEIAAIIAQPAARRWTPGLLALAGAALLFGGWWLGQKGAAPATSATEATPEARLAFTDPADDPRPSIAVLPFEDMSPQGDQEYFSDGMTEEIGSVLVRAGKFRVPARTSAFAYKEHVKDVKQIGDELGVSYVVEGSVRKAGDMFRITAQLVETDTDASVWTEQYDRELTAANLLEVQSEIAMAIAEALTVPLGLETAAQLVTPTADLEAYDLYLAGRAHMRERAGGGESLAEAIQLFDAAIAHDSNFAPAWASLAEAKEISVWWPATYTTHDTAQDRASIAARALAESERAANQALELDPRNASAMVALASVHRDRGEWTEAENLYLRALEIDPYNAEAHHQYGELLGSVGRIAEAVRSTDRAAVLDPAPVRMWQIGFSLELDDRLEEAAEVYKLAMQLDPDVRFGPNWHSGYHALARLGRTEEALHAARVLEASIYPDDDPWPTARWDSAVSALAEANFELVPGDSLVGWLGLRSDELVAMGRPDSAVIAYLNSNRFTTDGLHHHRIIWFPEFDALRSDPRIRAYMEEAGLADAVVQRTPVAARTRPMILERR